MKINIRWAIAICVLGISLSGTAQVPPLINYQGRLTDLNGAPLVNETNNPADGQIDLVFQIFDALTGGNSIWNQTNSDVAVNNGLFSVLLSGLNETIFPATNQIARWLEVGVSDLTVTNTLSPRKEIVSVAYAIRASDADMVDGKHANELGGVTNEVDPLWASASNAIVTDIGTRLVSNVWAAADSTTNYLARTGGTMSGALNMGAQFVTNATYFGDGRGLTNLAAGAYNENDPLWTSASTAIVSNIAARLDSNVWAVADSTTNYLARTGGTMSGELNMQGNVITNAIITNTTYYGDGHGLTNLAAGVYNEDDPQVGVIANNSVPNWDGLQLVTGSIYNDPAGNVGIGTESPQAKLVVMGSGATPAVQVEQIFSLNRPQASSWPNVASFRLGQYAAEVNGKTRLDIALKNSANANIVDLTTVMTLQGDGNVGIGTANPQARLDVRGQLLVDPGNIHAAPFSESALIEGAGLSVMNNAGTGDSYIYIGKTTATANYGYIGYDYSESKLKLFNFGDITFEQTGNVGIGTPAPAAKLDVNGPAVIRGNVGIGTASPGAKLDISDTYVSNTGYQERFKDDTSVSLNFGGLNNGNKWLQAQNAAGASIYYSILLNPLGGNVGIGTPSPTAKLDVNGNARIRGDTIAIGGGGIFQLFGGSGQQPFLQLRAQDNYTVLVPPGPFGGFRVTDYLNSVNNIDVKDNGYLWVRQSPVLYSDSRIKLDQRELDYGLAQVMALKPKRYNRAEWEQDKKTGKIIIHPEKKENDIGLVAQDIQEIIPEAVVVPEEGDDQLLGIAYPKLIPVLIKAIQDQQKQIEKLEDKITRLEKKTGNQVK